MIFLFHSSLLNNFYFFSIFFIDTVTRLVTFDFDERKHNENNHDPAT